MEASLHFRVVIAGSGRLGFSVALMTPRCTFCFPDSCFEPSAFGTASRMSLISLVLDPCFRDTEVEALARQLPCPLEWHPGFRLHVEQMAQHPSYRGPEFVALGRSVAVDGWLTPAIHEEAVRTERHHLQDLKKVWHYLARFGDQSTM